MTLRLYPIFQDELRVRELTNQFFNHSMQLLMRLGRLESEGIDIDESELDVIRRNLRERAVALKCKVCEMLGKPFDLDSGTELTAILVQAFGLLLLSFALGFSDSHISRAFLLDLLTVTTIRHGMMKKFCRRSPVGAPGRRSDGPYCGTHPLQVTQMRAPTRDRLPEFAALVR